MSEQSPRVNAARLPSFAGRTVRLPCKLINQYPGGALVEACDRGQVEVTMREDEHLEGAFFELIGLVVGESKIKLMHPLSFSSDKGVDMELFNDAIELTFHPKVKKIFPS